MQKIWKFIVKIDKLKCDFVFWYEGKKIKCCIFSMCFSWLVD